MPMEKERKYKAGIDKDDCRKNRAENKIQLRKASKDIHASYRSITRHAMGETAAASTAFRAAMASAKDSRSAEKSRAWQREVVTAEGRVWIYRGHLDSCIFLIIRLPW